MRVTKEGRRPMKRGDGEGRNALSSCLIHSRLTHKTFSPFYPHIPGIVMTKHGSFPHISTPHVSNHDKVGGVREIEKGKGECHKVIYMYVS